MKRLPSQDPLCRDIIASAFKRNKFLMDKSIKKTSEISFLPFCLTFSTGNRHFFSFSALL